MDSNDLKGYELVQVEVNENAAELRKKIAEQEEEIKQLKSKKKFGLVWEDKPDAQVLRVRNEAPMLCEDTTRAVVTDENDVDHILINGDNFHALTALRATHTGKIDVIYIDPPYNTGNKDFIYNDNYLDKEDGYRHSKWLSFMNHRLALAKELLSDSGVIFVSIDDNEQARLKLLMDEIFGPENFISNVTWGGGIKNNAKYVSSTSDYFIIYAKSLVTLTERNARWRVSKSGVQEIIDEADALMSKNKGDHVKSTSELKSWYKKLDASHPSKGEKANQMYLNIDKNGRVFKIAWPDAPKDGPRFEVLHPNGKPSKIPASGWRYTEVRMQELIEEGTIEFLENETKLPILKRFLDSTSDKVLADYFIADRRSSNVLLQNIIGRAKFDFPKDHEVLAQWISYVSENNPNAVILDFFAGSGSTGHAVAELNKRDKGRRQCILVTDGGKTEASGESSKNAKEGAVNIAEEITYERVRRVLTGKDWADGKEHQPLGGNLRYFKVKMESTPHGITELDQRLALEGYTIEHAKIATNIFNEVVSKNELDDDTLMTVDYKVYADEAEGRYLIGVNAHDFALTELEKWFNSLSAEATVIMVGNGLEEIEWVRKNAGRITVDDVLGRVIRSRKYVASKLPLI